MTLVAAGERHLVQESRREVLRRAARACSSTALVQGALGSAVLESRTVDILLITVGGCKAAGNAHIPLRATPHQGHTLAAILGMHRRIDVSNDRCFASSWG